MKILFEIAICNTMTTLKSLSAKKVIEELPQECKEELAKSLPQQYVYVRSSNGYFYWRGSIFSTEEKAEECSQRNSKILGLESHLKILKVPVHGVLKDKLYVIDQGNSMPLVTSSKDLCFDYLKFYTRGEVKESDVNKKLVTVDEDNDNDIF